MGSLLITERSLLRQIKSLLPDESAVQQKVAKLLIAFSWSLKHQLRGTDPTADLYHNLSSQELAEVIASPMPTNRILLMLGQEIGKLLRRQGAAERHHFRAARQQAERTVPRPRRLRTARQHAGAVRLYPDPAAHRLPVLQPVAFCPGDRPALHDTVCFSVHFYTFLSWDSLAEELEDPFGVSANHLPLNAICNTIERNLLEMNDQSPLPPPMKPDEHFNLI